MTTATATAFKLPDLDTVYHCEGLGTMTLGQIASLHFQYSAHRAVLLAGMAVHEQLEERGKFTCATWTRHSWAISCDHADDLRYRRSRASSCPPALTSRTSSVLKNTPQEVARQARHGG